MERVRSASFHAEAAVVTNVFDWMSQAGWEYNSVLREFWKGDLHVLFEQAERAVFDAQHGIDRSVRAEAANDDEAA